MLNTLIIDDMPLAIASLEADLSNYHPDIKVLGSANGVLEGAKKIKSLKPDFIFLDIHMGDGDGFDLLEIIETENIKIIFTTASKDHAIKAFQFNAVDYLLKPIDPDLLSLAIQKVKDSIQEKNFFDTPDSITLNTQDEIRLVKVSEIIRLEAMGNYCTFYLSDKSKILVTKTMKEFEKMIGTNFVRVHQSHLVNLDYIKSYKKTEGGYLLLKTDETVPVSFRKRSHLLDVLSKKK